MKVVIVVAVVVRTTRRSSLTTSLNPSWKCLNCSLMDWFKSQSTYKSTNSKREKFKDSKKSLYLTQLLKRRREYEIFEQETKTTRTKRERERADERMREC
jgi:hypothetical protein